MRVRAIDINHDWLFGKGQNDYVVNNSAVAQSINTRLNSFLGDCFFDNGAGIDWLTFCGGSKNQTALNLAIGAVILNTPDENGNQCVTGILQLSVSLNETTRAFTINYVVQTIFSTVRGTFVFDLGGSN